VRQGSRSEDVVPVAPPVDDGRGCKSPGGFARRAHLRIVELRWVCSSMRSLVEERDRVVVDQLAERRLHCARVSSNRSWTVAEIYTEPGRPSKGGHWNWSSVAVIAAVILALIIVAIARS
jgi:hypothetical protein